MAQGDDRHTWKYKKYVIKCIFMTKPFNWNEAQWFSHWFGCLKLNTGQKQHGLWGWWNSTLWCREQGHILIWPNHIEMKNLAQNTGWKSYSRRKIVLKLLQVDTEEQIIGLLWNCHNGNAKKKKKFINEALQQTNLCEMQNLFLRLYSKQLHIKISRKLTFSPLKDKG